MRWTSIGKMMDKVRQNAAAEEKKKDDDLKKKEEASKKLEDEKPGNLLVSVVRKVIKEEQTDSYTGVETDNKEGFKDTAKAADDCATRVGSGKGVDRDKIHKGKGKGDSLKEKTSQTKGKSKGNPKQKVESPQSQRKMMERVQKNVVSPGKTGGGGRGRIQAKVERKTLGKVVRKDKQRRQEWRQSKEGSNVTFTDVQRLFMKLMKGANEEDWNL